MRSTIYDLRSTIYDLRSTIYEPLLDDHHGYFAQGKFAKLEFRHFPRLLEQEFSKNR